MGLTEAVKSVFGKYATFSGRATRSEYWFFALFNILLSVVLILGLGILGAIFKGTEGFGIGMVIGYVLYAIYSFIALIPSLAVTVRRLHDSGKSGWFWFFALIPFVGSIILFVFMVLGSDGDNQYGPNPNNVQY